MRASEIREELELAIRMRNDEAANGNMRAASELDQAIRDRFGICPDCLLQSHGMDACVQAV